MYIYIYMYLFIYTYIYTRVHTHTCMYTDLSYIICLCFDSGLGRLQSD